MSIGAPIPFRWDGEAMAPLNQRFSKECDKRFTVGEVYPLIEHEQRSMASHRHYFATIYDAWESLPECFSGQFPTSEHLRKRALIDAGYRDQRTLVASSKAEALRLAAFVRPMDEYAFVSVAGCTVVVMTAKTQSLKGMDAKEFAQSKDAVLRVIADMLSVSPDDLRRQGEAA